MMEFQTILKQEDIFKPSEIKYVLDNYIPDEVLINTNKQITYFDIPCAFDIETTSTYINNEKTAFMYEWTLGINGSIIIGRTWEEFTDILKYIIEYCELNSKRRIIIYVHNLGYEFQFICKRFEWLKVFCIDSRKPIYAVTVDGIEFRCSYLLSGYNLASLGKNLIKYKVEKLEGFLDYSLIRTFKTILTDKEIAYCVNDVKVVMAYIQEQIETEGNITKIPLTKTGYVRKYCRAACFNDGKPRRKSEKYKKYTKLMKSLKLDPEEYKQLKRAFQGGFTHANPYYSDKISTEVHSIDFTSSYPAVMIAEQFPMSRAEEIIIRDNAELNKNLDLYCCLFDIDIINIKPKILFDNYISTAKCSRLVKPSINNGRLVSADLVSLTVTELDYKLIKKFYTWDNCRIYNFKRYKKGYLPTDLVKSILKLYSDKTTLKSVSGKENEYMISKGMLNSVYGMAVTDIVKPIISYTDDWEVSEVDYGKEILKYNNSRNRFLFYPWGVWVTAYARYNLLINLIKIGYQGDYIYTDTDSIKFKNIDKHRKTIEEYNKLILFKLKKAMDHHNLPHELIEPETIKGVKKPLGVWDYEGCYSRFKSLGAKRYMTEEDNKISITVSGLNKKVAVPFLVDNYNDPFEVFTDGLYIPKEYTGKKTHTYIDKEISGTVTDYQGKSANFHEFTAVHLESSDYDLSIARQYLDYIQGIYYDRS